MNTECLILFATLNFQNSTILVIFKLIIPKTWTTYINIPIYYV